MQLSKATRHKASRQTSEAGYPLKGSCHKYVNKIDFKGSLSSVDSTAILKSGTDYIQLKAVPGLLNTYYFLFLLDYLIYLMV